ncbi:MAG: hypothetical protein H6719_37730 [Sandaracinaceae bacterium]|nr:hypothetical protein [Sandaracinaceae bacterium]
MSPRAKRIVAVVAALAALAIVLPFAIRWSRPCEEERERARATWTSYADHVAGTRAEAEARAVLEALDGDLGEAVEHGDSVLAAPAPDDERGATLYREALERLSLAEGACGADW